MRRWVRLVGCSITFLSTIGCARTALDLSDVAETATGGSTGAGGSNSVTCPHGYAGPRCDTPIFVALAVPADSEFCRVNRISGDCSTAVGYCRVDGSTRAMKWDAATGKASILPSPSSAHADGSNRDGSLIVGTIYPAESPSTSSGVVWTSTEGEPTKVDQATYINAVSDDGRIAIGSTSEGVAYWDISNLFTSGTTPHPIVGTTNPDWKTYLYDLSSDGSVIVGTVTKVPIGRATPEAAIRWTEATGPVALIPTPDGDITDQSLGNSSADVVSGDGKVAFGVLIGWNENTPVRWPATGELEYLPPEYSLGISPDDTNFDGSIIVGSDHGRVVLWDTSGSMQRLGTMLAQIDAFPSELGYYSFAAGICNDGTVLVGSSEGILWAIHLKGTGLLGL